MSSVVISGDTSGTVTLQAPATAGSTTLTLPSTSGTVVTTATTTGISGSAITTGTVGVTVGGTGLTTCTTGDIRIGSGSNTLSNLAIGANNTVLTSNGTTATWAAASSGQIQTQLFTTPGTWTKPASCTQVRVTVVGGGGSAAGPGTPGGRGGMAIAISPVSGPVAITIGTGGSGGTSGGGSGNTSSFGALVSATGGSGTNTTSGTGTVTTGTALRTGNILQVSNGSGALGILVGTTQVSPPSPANQAYSTSQTYIAGATGTYNAPSAPSYAGGVDGAVVVEFVG
jgi:hypothetical protein